jgi:hypothetical protein
MVQFYCPAYGQEMSQQPANNTENTAVLPETKSKNPTIASLYGNSEGTCNRPGQQQPATAPPSTSGLSIRTDQSSFFRRLFKVYADDWKPAGASASAPSPAPAFRGDPAPVNGPPFPFSTWPIGGTVSIGQPWTQAGPLMTALWEGPHGDFWKNSKIQIYGWLNVGANFSTSKGGVNPSEGKYDNYPTAYDEVPNAIEPDQEVLYIERQPDTVQTASTGVSAYPASGDSITVSPPQRAISVNNCSGIHREKSMVLIR